MVTLSKDFALDRISMPFPNVKVLEPSDALALVVPSLPKGDLAVICEYQGSIRKLASVAYSALVVNTITKVSPVEFNKDENTCVVCKTPLEVMEAMC